MLFNKNSTLERGFYYDKGIRIMKSEIINIQFTRLVENACDFLEQSMTDIRDKPKYSVIHFHTAIELLLKARLLAEHWSLVITSRKEADWNTFSKGDFVSVSLDECVKKLEKIVQSPIHEKAVKIFKNVTNHRNQMVHFYHASHTSEERDIQTQIIIKEQLTAWYFLHELLLNQWSDIFSNHKERILEIDSKLKKLHIFLEVVYENKKEEIDSQKMKFDFLACPACNFESAKHNKNGLDELYEAKCLVCEFSFYNYLTKCPSCQTGNLRYLGLPYANCESCEFGAGNEILFEKCVGVDAYSAHESGLGYSFPISCGVCSGYETVIELPNEKFLCTDCFNVESNYGCCEWCNNPSTNLSDMTYVTGCEFCEGRMGWEKDD